ncbi:MAG: hypothetical protein LAQ30_23540, partial [Acidobacteriia bacterium]|nr:hypothetical protein [Terriglobia bacterium]
MMRRISDSKYGPSSALLTRLPSLSGQALPGTAGTGRLGNISPLSLEMSNVDLAEEFVKMITT